MINYIITRINVPADLSIGSFKVVLFQFSGDLTNNNNNNILDIICDKPDALEPCHIHFKKNVTLDTIIIIIIIIIIIDLLLQL